MPPLPHPYRTFIHQYATLSDRDWEAVRERLTLREITRGTTLLREGDVCRHVWFAAKGLLHYTVNREGDEVTKFFTVAPYCFTSQRSFNTGSPARESIVALEDCTLWEMSKTSVDELFHLPRWSAYVRALTQEVQFYTEEILEALQNRTAEERYRKMIVQVDPLLQRVALRHLASYLGIAPQSLSRIRRRVAEEGEGGVPKDR